MFPPHKVWDGVHQDNVTIKMESVTQLAAGPLFIKKTFLKVHFWGFEVSFYSLVKQNGFSQD